MKKGSLNKKNFFITSLSLIFCGITIFFIVIKFVPAYYKEKIATEKMEGLNKLNKECNNLVYENSAEAFDNYLNYTINSFVNIALFDESGEPCEIPLAKMKDYFPQETRGILTLNEILSIYKYQRGELDEYNENSIALFDEFLLDSDIITKEITFKDGSKYIILVVYYTTPISDLSEVLIKMIPYGIIIIVIIALIFSFICSKLITKPIIDISNISKKMVKEKNLSIKYEINSNDEIGIIGNSLNQLTGKLAASLEELNNMNKCLEEDIKKEKEIEKKRREFFLESSYKLNKPLEKLENNYEKMIDNDDDEIVDICLENSLEVVEEMESIVKELLKLSKLDINNNQN